MRVLHLTRDFPPRSAGGISTAVGALVTAAQRARPGSQAVLSFDGWRPRQAGPSGSAPRRDPETDGAPPTLRLSEPAHLDAARAFSKGLRPSRIHVHHALLWDLGAELGQTLGVPALYTAHVLQAHLSALRGLTEPTLSDEAEARALSEAAAISAPTRAALQALASFYPQRASGLHLTGLAPSLKPARSAPSPTPRLLHVGRFDPLKGTGELLAAIPRLLAAHPALTFEVAGGLPENPRAHRRWMRRFQAIAHPRLEVRGWLSEHEVALALARATHFVAPSHAETCGLSLLEAGAAGLALIASDIPAHREIAPGADFFRPGDPDSLITAANKSLTHRTRGQPEELPLPLSDWLDFWDAPR